MPSDSKRALKSSTSLSTADPLKQDFRKFLWVIWNHLNLPSPTDVQYDIAHWLQRGPKRLVIEAYRGVGKSWITAAFVCWLLYCDPQLNIMVVSASKRRADDFSTFVLRLLAEVPILQHLMPKTNQRSSKVAFDVAPAQADQAPSVKSVGITGQLTGSRADVIIADDIEVPNNSATQGMRDKLSEAVKEFDAVLKPGGRVIYLGTPQTEQSIYNRLSDRGYTIRIWPSRYPTAEKRDKYGPLLAPLIANRLDQDPELADKPADRFTEDDLQERELSYGRQGFALQFQLDTSLSDADRYPLRLSDLIIHPLDPTKAPIDFMWASGPQQALDLPSVGLQGDRFHRPGWVAPEAGAYEGCMMFVDPSGRGKDETAYAVVKQLHGRLFLLSSGGFRDGYSDETLKKLIGIAKRYNVNVIQAEPNYGGGMFTTLLRSTAHGLYPVKIEDAEWSKGQKEARIIDTLEPVLAQHRLVVCPSVVEADYSSTESYGSEEVQRYRLFYQMTRITADRGSLSHDDRIEALAGAVSYWEKALGKDTLKAAEAHSERLLDDELQKFIDHANGWTNKFGETTKSSTNSRWCSATMRG